MAKKTKPQVTEKEIVQAVEAIEDAANITWIVATKAAANHTVEVLGDKETRNGVEYVKCKYKN